MTTKPIVIIMMVCLSMTSFVGPFVGDVETHAPCEEDAKTFSLDDEVIDRANGLLELGGSSFIENLGQVGSDRGRFYVEGDPLSVAFSPGHVTYFLRGGPMSDVPASFQAFFKDAKPVAPEGVGALGHRTNYFLGNRPEGWVVGARSYQEVWYRSLWDGIDLGYSINDGLLKYIFEVQPFVDPSTIRMDYHGVVGLDVDPATDGLVIDMGSHIITDLPPLVFQEAEGRRSAVDCNYQVTGGTIVSFRLGEYDASRILYVDPGLEFSTFFGGSIAERLDLGSRMIDIDEAGNIYIIGVTSSADLPTSQGAFCSTGNGAQWDSFVAKFNPSCTQLLLCTYFGGTSGQVNAQALVVDRLNRPCIAGFTNSADFPITSDAQDSHLDSEEGFFLLFNQDGTELLYGTYFGGSNDDWTQDMCFDNNMDVIMAGYTNSTDLETSSDAYDKTLNGGYDFFVARMNMSTKDITLCTYLGGSGEEATSCTCGVDIEDRILLAAATSSDDFPTTPDAFCATLAGDSEGVFLRLNPNGSSLNYSTYIGGNDDDSISQLVVTSDSSVWLTGKTYSQDIPVTPDAFQPNNAGGFDEAFFACVAPNGDLDYCSYFGGNGQDWGNSIYWTAENEIILYGRTTSTDFLMPSGAYDMTLGGPSWDAYILWLNISTGQIINATYVGGNVAVGGEFCAVGGLTATREGVIVITGSTNSPNYPVTNGAYDATLDGSEAYITGISMGRTPHDPPSIPRNLTVQPGDGYIDLSWRPPSNDGGWPIKGYRIYRGEGGGCATYLADSTTTQFSSMGLVNGYEYAFRVSAVTRIGEGPRTDLVIATPFGTPSPPINVTLVPGDRNVTLTWESPTDNGDLEILGYEVHRGTSLDVIGLLETVGNVTAYNDTGLTNGQRYYYQVRAFHRLAGGILSSVKSVVPFGPPTAPQSLNVVIGDRLNMLSWVAPQSDGGGIIKTYRIFRGYQAEELERLTSIPPTLSYTDMNVTNGLRYHYTVSAVNDAGEGPRSDVVSAVPLGPPGAPEDLMVEPGNGQVTLHWFSPVDTGGTPVTGYRVFRGTAPDALVVVASIGPLDTYTDKGLTNGVTYHYQVRARTLVGEGTPSVTVSATPIGLPSAPVGLDAVAGYGKVDLSWLPPQETGGAPITSYRVYRAAGADALELLKEIGATAASYTDAELINGRTYRYAVSASNGRLEGAMGDVVAVIPFGPPGAPMHLTLFLGESGIELDWTAPETDGGRALQGFRIYRGTSPTGLVLYRELGVTMSFVDDAITKGATYHYAVSAVNEAGEGSSSETISLRYATLPDVPAGFTTATKGATATLTWRAPLDTGGVPITGYKVLRGNSSDDLKLLATVGNVLTYMDTTVERGKEYYYSVVAVNDVGDGPATTPLKVEVSRPHKDSPGFAAALCALGLVTAVGGRMIGIGRASKGGR